MKTSLFLFCLHAPLLSSSVTVGNERIFSLFAPDCSRPVFAPFGLYNPCPDTATTTFGFWITGLLNSLLGIPSEEALTTTPLCIFTVGGEDTTLTSYQLNRTGDTTLNILARGDQCETTMEVEVSTLVSQKLI